MIYVSQGHEHSIGLEVFLKSFILLTKQEQQYFTLVCSIYAITETLNSLGIEHEYNDSNFQFSNSTLKYLKISKRDLPESTESLNMCLELLDQNRDILLTLPTSKDQLIDLGILRAGYTEYLRHRYNALNTSMVFSAESDHYLLITDHIPLSDVTKSINKTLIVEKVSNTINGYSKYFSEIEEVIFAGINPHAGENGILGSEDVVITSAISNLKEKFPSINFMGPYSGDTLHFYNNHAKTQLKVYMYHDQGLPIFKALNGTIGLNISLGLPFLRMSVDHGTAFSLYKKNCSDYQGALYLLKKGISAHQRINS